MEYLASGEKFSSLSLKDLLEARDQFHAHLVHKANVVGTAIGRYLIRKDEPIPQCRSTLSSVSAPKSVRTLENSEVRDYSWPCVLVFVSQWEDDTRFGSGDANLTPSDFIPKTIYLED